MNIKIYKHKLKVLFSNCLKTILVLGLLCITAFGFAQKNSKYLRYLDSANVKLNESTDIALRYLDSIPRPLENSIDGHLAEYYNLKFLAYENIGENTELFKYLLLAYQHAKKEENYNISGKASLELFYNLYITKKDSLAFDYLEKAEYYYKKENNKYGLLDVMQAPELVEFYNGDYKNSNALILPKLNHYKSIEEDGYYYMFSLFMLTSNYLHLNDTVESKKYYGLFKLCELDTTISPRLYKRHEVTLLICMAESFVEARQPDSVKHYISKARELRPYMNSSDIKNYFNNLVDYCDLIDDKTAQQRYLDSIDLYQSKWFDNAMKVNFEISESLVERNEDLIEESGRNDFNRFWIFVLSLLVVVLVVFVTVKYKHIKEKFIELTQQNNEFGYLNKSHEKLKVKVQELEKFIGESKKEIKRISNIEDTKKQKEQIKELYKNIHLHSSTLIDNGEDHFKLINELNVYFFNNIATKHPQLNHSEIIVCYYIYAGFKNKDIAAFLNTSVRAVESKRYRITKKMDLKTKSSNLQLYLSGMLND